MSERKLVTVRRIDTIVRHTQSANLNVVTIDGWQIVVSRQLGFAVEEQVLFCEIDSFLPASDARLRMPGNSTKYDGTQGHRVLTTMVSAQISQGAIFHLRDFPEIMDELTRLPIEDHGNTDFAEKLGVKKWQLPTGKKAQANLGSFPVFIGNCSSVRVQNCPNFFTKPKYKKLVYQETVKMDGCTVTCYFVRKDSPYYKSLPDLPGDAASSAHVVHDNGRFGVCTNNSDLKHALDSIPWQAAIHYGIPSKLAALGKNIAIQGELVGSTIQKNRHEYPEGEHEFLVFSVFDIDKQERWCPLEVESFAASQRLEHVGVLGYHALPDIARHHEDLLARASTHPDEGLVFKCLQDGRWFKVISNYYLLKHGI